MKFFAFLQTLVSRNVRRTSTFQIILIAVILHSLASILLIYVHLRSLFEYEISNYEPRDLFSREGGIEFARRRQQLNLVSSRAIDRFTDLMADQRGWWSDDHESCGQITCFPQKWILCAKVFSIKCMQQSVRSISQFLPIRKGAHVQNLKISAKSKTDGLVQQAGPDIESSFGVSLLIHCSDGTVETLRIEFPSDLSDWTKRSIVYSSPPGTNVVDITIMLSCIGYTGVVAFTDIEIISETASNIWSSPESVLATCSSERTSDFRTARHEEESKFRLLSWRATERQPECKESQFTSNVTVGMHVPLDRIAFVKKSLQHWFGLVSLTVIVTVANISDELTEGQRLYLDKEIENLSLSKCSRVNLALVRESDLLRDFHLTFLQNYTIGDVLSRYLILVDDDFQISPGLEQLFQGSLGQQTSANQAFVVPAFEFIENFEDVVVRRKTELLQLIFREDPAVQPFESPDALGSHKLTNYFKWYSSQTMYPVTRTSHVYEPFVIVDKRGITHEMRSSHRLKFSQQLLLSGHSFWVLPNAWLIKYPTTRGSDTPHTLTRDHSTALQNWHSKFDTMFTLSNESSFCI